MRVRVKGEGGGLGEGEGWSLSASPPRDMYRNAPRPHHTAPSPTPTLPTMGLDAGTGEREVQSTGEVQSTAIYCNLLEVQSTAIYRSALYRSAIYSRRERGGLLVKGPSLSASTPATAVGGTERACKAVELGGTATVGDGSTHLG